MKKVLFQLWGVCLNKGFIFSFEATLSILIFSLILISLPYSKTDNYSELIIIQQENDLLKVWSKNYSETEMIKDIKQLFESASLFVNDIKILEGNKTNAAISSEGILLDEFLNEKRVRVVVYLK